jgi:hypothetical protein
MTFLKGIKQVKIQYLFSNLSKEEISEWRSGLNSKKSEMKNSSNFFQRNLRDGQKQSIPLRDESTIETPLYSKLRLAMGFSERVFILRNNNKGENVRERTYTKHSTFAGKPQNVNSLGKKSEKSSVTIRNTSKANTRILSGTTSKLFRSLKTSNLQSFVPTDPTVEKEAPPKFEYFQVKDLINKRIRNDTYETVTNLAKEYREIRVKLTKPGFC